MVHAPPLVPVQELEALEQQMSEMDAGTESHALKQGGVKRKHISGTVNEGEGQYVAYSPDMHPQSVVLSTWREQS